MQALLIPLLFIIGVVAWSIGGSSLAHFNIGSFLQPISFSIPKNSHTPKYAKPSNSYTAPATKITLPKNFIVHTKITSGPNNNAIIANTNSVTFTFSGSATPPQQATPTFETKVEGLDTSWQKTTKHFRTIIFPNGNKHYIFLVRALINGAPDDIPALRAFTISLSQYFGKVNINNASNGNGVTLSNNSNSSINVTGWVLKGKWSGTLSIPTGQAAYYPGNPNTDIIMKPGEVMDMLEQNSPLGAGRNFKTNKCFGYLHQQAPLLPGSVSCPHQAPTLQSVSNMYPSCQEFLLHTINYSSCVPLDLTNYQNLDGACKSYINNFNQEFNYSSCYFSHAQDTSFISSTWYVYIGKRNFPNSLHDILTLSDKNNLLIARYQY